MSLSTDFMTDTGREGTSKVTCCVGQAEGSTEAASARPSLWTLEESEITEVNDWYFGQ